MGSEALACPDGLVRHVLSMPLSTTDGHGLIAEARTVVDYALPLQWNPPAREQKLFIPVCL
jgi:hypothetical protein|eukprot:COSAG02_NODE_5351_length_4407_cov_4.772516_1_plen_61_part_00